MMSPSRMAPTRVVAKSCNVLKAAVQRLYDDAQRRVVEKHGIDLTL